VIYKRGLNWHMDVTVQGVRYREALNTTDKREATALEKKRVGEIQQGKGASRHGREFAHRPFAEALEAVVRECTPHCAERTIQLYRERGDGLPSNSKRLHYFASRLATSRRTSRRA
jgi:hypothetical protein